MTNALREKVMKLDEAERIALMIEIWESLNAAHDPELTDAERRLIEARLQEHRDTPHDTVPLEEAERRLRRESP